MDRVTTPVMACPVCRTALALAERQGIEIDYCPTCRGVWLDRGELDKIVERSGAAHPAAGRSPTGGASPWDADPHAHGGSRKRRRSFLEELFD